MEAGGAGTFQTLTGYLWSTGTRDEADGVVADLRVLPELHVAVVEDVGVRVDVVEALRREHHAHVVARVKQRQRLQEEVRDGDLRTTTQSGIGSGHSSQTRPLVYPPAGAAAHVCCAEYACCRASVRPQM